MAVRFGAIAHCICLNLESNCLKSSDFRSTLQVILFCVGNSKFPAWLLPGLAPMVTCSCCLISISFHLYSYKSCTPLTPACSMVTLLKNNNEQVIGKLCTNFVHILIGSSVCAGFVGLIFYESHYSTFCSILDTRAIVPL